MVPPGGNHRPRMGFEAIVAATFAVILAGCIPGLQQQPPSVVAGTPGPDMLPAQDLRPLGRALAIRLIDASGEGLVPEGLIRRAERRLDLVKGVRLGTVAFLLAVIEERGQTAPVVAGLVHDGEAWQLEDLEAVRTVPAIGSNGFELVEAIAGGFIGVGGFVDPSLLRLDAVDPFGQVVDVDDPFAGGVLLLSSRFGVVRVHGDGRILGAQPIRVPATEAELEELRPVRLEPSSVEDARSVADRFVETFLTGGWVPAAPLYNPQGRPDLLLPELARVLPSGRWDVTGSPQVTEQGFTYPIDGPAGEARLAVRLNRWQGEWRVAVVEFRTPPEGSGPIG
jgi:hypothetical protein